MGLAWARRSPLRLVLPVRSFPRPLGPELLCPRLTAAPGAARLTPPRVKCRGPPLPRTRSSSPRIRPGGVTAPARHFPSPRFTGLRYVVPPRPRDASLLWRSCSSPRRAVASFLQPPPRGDALAVASEFSSGILRSMQGNLLPGTSTPKLTPMPGVHQPVTTLPPACGSE